ncbi:MAG: phenylacetate--CoA ligase [Dehalococcoidia bacterium]|nr:phenylacetate--CoA ligase [Dehalococcoidia bacterium]
MLIIHPHFETMPRQELEELQLERLKKIVSYVYERVPFYHDNMQKLGVKPEDIQTLADVAKLPFTSKLDFRDNYPFGLTCVPQNEIVCVHSSSGTTGKPVIAPYTQKDIDTWAELVARSLACAGITREDILQNAYGYGMFTGGLGLHNGGKQLGAAVIPASTGNTKRQLMMIQDLGTTAISCTPSYALILHESAQELGIDLYNSTLRIGILGAEPWSENMRADIESKLGITALGIYGLTEIMGPGVSMECPHKSGMHIWEDTFLAEIIDPITGKPLPYGEQGELVITTLTKEAQPILRFRTKDITSLNIETCACGRTMARMARITGRSDDMIRVRGVSVFPSQIESVLLTVEGIAPQYMIVVDRQNAFASDELEIWVEVSESIFSDEMTLMTALQMKLQRELDSVLGVKARIKLVEPRKLARTEGKAKRVVDRSELPRL